MTLTLLSGRARRSSVTMETLPHLPCAGCFSQYACPASVRGRAPKCSGCRRATQTGGRQHAHAESAPQNGAAAGAPQPCHLTPCACHCAACRAAGHGNGACVVLCAGLHALFDGKADVVDLVACGTTTERAAGARCALTRKFSAGNTGPPATSSRRVVMKGATLHLRTNGGENCVPSEGRRIGLECRLVPMWKEDGSCVQC